MLGADLDCPRGASCGPEPGRAPPSAARVLQPPDSSATATNRKCGGRAFQRCRYVLVQPGANPVLYVTRAEGDNKPEKPGSEEEGSGGGGGVIDNFVNFVFGFVPSNPFQGITGGATTPKPEEPTTTKPEKDEKKFDEDEPPKNVPLIPSPGQRFVVIGQPQFFGNYDAFRNHAVQQNLGTGGAVSSFLLLKNQDVVPLASAANGKVQEEPEKVVPGASALEFQRYINAVKEQQQQQDQQQNVVYVARQPIQPNIPFHYLHRDDDRASVTVDALKVRPNKKEGDEDSEDAEDVEANPPGPSVAQVKPQAIALAGPGGMAAAAPVGTAVVGPEGIAVAAPHATAVAGPSGGPPTGAHPSSALSSPAAYKAYLLDQQSKGAYPGSSFHVAYTA
ncbi:hypothetical protein C0J52_24404 [Blattella germanica]|nr:hypothetical protein C0J52_24404 [Blattella germanica]